MKKVRVRRVCSTVGHASELPRTDRSELMDCVAQVQ